MINGLHEITEMMQVKRLIEGMSNTDTCKHLSGKVLKKQRKTITTYLFR